VSDEATSKPNRPPSTEKKLDAGIKRAYEVYGPDLAAFFSAVTAAIAKRAEPDVTKRHTTPEKSR
jgi:hypothetical protein